MIPWLEAMDFPPLGWVMTVSAGQDAACSRMIARVRSVEPSSTAMTSRFG